MSLSLPKITFSLNRKFSFDYDGSYFSDPRYQCGGMDFTKGLYFGEPLDYVPPRKKEEKPKAAPGYVWFSIEIYFQIISMLYRSIYSLVFFFW